MLANKLWRTKTSVIYVGRQNYQLLCQYSREINFQVEANIKPSQFLKFLINEYVNAAKEELILKIENEKKMYG